MKTATISAALIVVFVVGFSASLLQHAPAQPKPLQLTPRDDADKWIADHGRPDLITYDRFLRLADQVWRIRRAPGTLWIDTDVECLTYLRYHLTVYFVMARDRESDSGYSFRYLGCSDSRTGHPLEAAEVLHRF